MSCQRCASLRDLKAARGPDGIADRIRWMLELTDDGSFTISRTTRGLSWEDLDRAEITARKVHIAADFAEDVPDTEFTIRCETCTREFTQGWIAERGYERWVMRAQ